MRVIFFGNAGLNLVKAFFVAYHPVTYERPDSARRLIIPSVSFAHRVKASFRASKSSFVFGTRKALCTYSFVFGLIKPILSRMWTSLNWLKRVCNVVNVPRNAG